jgi:hypothetical protein
MTTRAMAIAEDQLRLPEQPATRVLISQGDAAVMAHSSAPEEPRQPPQARAPLLLRIGAIVIAGTAVSAGPDEPQRAVHEALSFD